MSDSTRESVIGGIWLMWSGNPQLRLGELLNHFIAIEGTTLQEASDLIWPQREWKFCPFCGSADPASCMDASDPESCLAQLWDDPDAEEWEDEEDGGDDVGGGDDVDSGEGAAE